MEHKNYLNSAKAYRDVPVVPTKYQFKPQIFYLLLAKGSAISNLARNWKYCSSVSWVNRVPISWACRTHIITHTTTESQCCPEHTLPASHPKVMSLDHSVPGDGASWPEVYDLFQAAWQPHRTQEVECTQAMAGVRKVQDSPCFNQETNGWIKRRKKAKIRRNIYVWLRVNTIVVFSITSSITSSGSSGTG